MSYAVKEIFYTLQGEGLNSGRSAVFLRFSGCNLWSGRLDRREGLGGCAKWCDTDFVGLDGIHGGKYDAKELVARVESLWPSAGGSRFIVCTGGEPLLQLDGPLIDALHARGFEIAIETNGTIPVPPGIDWICVSPKAGAELLVREGDELKLVFPQLGIDPESIRTLQFRHFVLQPMDGPNRQHNMQSALEYCLAHPWWRLGVQAHKVLGIR
jgi:7-carboxy-7-deazaguanine synthase